MLGSRATRKGAGHVRYVEARGFDEAAAVAIPEGGFSKDKVEQGRYGPIFPKTPACYGFSLIAKVIPGREPVFREYTRGRTVERQCPSRQSRAMGGRIGTRLTGTSPVTLFC